MTILIICVLKCTELLTKAHAAFGQGRGWWGGEGGSGGLICHRILWLLKLPEGRAYSCCFVRLSVYAFVCPSYLSPEHIYKNIEDN